MSKLDKKKSIILGIIGLAIVIIIFVKVIPQIGDYSAAADAIAAMSTLAKVLIAVSVLIYLAVYGLPFMAATPGLRYWKSQQVNQAAFAISNGVPAGGAFGLAVQFAMLTSYRIPGHRGNGGDHGRRPLEHVRQPGPADLRRGRPDRVGRRHELRVGGARWASTILVVGIGLFVLVMRSESLALKIGNLANRLVSPLRPRIKALRDLDVVDADHQVPLRHVRAAEGAMGPHHRRPSSSVIMTQFLIFYVALRGVQGWDEPGTSVLAAFGAFATAQIMLMVPITPGGLGTVDALIISLLVSMGVDEGAATAADLVWRAASYVPQIIIGIIALVSWFRTAGRTYAAVTPDRRPDPGSRLIAFGVSPRRHRAAIPRVDRPGRRGRGSLRRPGLRFLCCARARRPRSHDLAALRGPGGQLHRGPDGRGPVRTAGIADGPTWWRPTWRVVRPRPGTPASSTRTWPCAGG